MRLIHTSDWHLGRAFHGVRLLDAQAAYLDHLVETARCESVDAVVVAGDVYDRAIPAPDAVELLSDVLHRLQAVGTQVVLSPGNHDSARRLGFGSGLLERAGVHIRTSVDDLARPVLVGDGAIYALPYLDPASVSITDALEVSTRSHAAVISAAMDRVRADAATRGPRTVVAAHCFAVGGASSDSERDIACGGVSAVPTSVFDGVSYVALGHLHGAQQVGERAWYSGSPVAMSFSEAGHTKCSLLVEVDGTGTAHVERVAAPVTRRLATLRGDLEDLLADPALEDAQDAWVQATLTDTLAPRRAMEQLRTRFPHTLSLVLDPRGGVVREHRRPSQVAGRAAVEVCTDFVADVRPGGTVGDDERALLREAVEAVQRAHDDEGSATTRERGVA
ncbi:exonuclease SbcCD subunit D [Janibacter melonis]|uniref:exonuclease SbcCD subunit D n=1 Tax=Janibacter melonis TaxID=262209 RepID=UPI00191A019C|nr:exonuclease SbcCD subunit D [Janibacter melonis]